MAIDINNAIIIKPIVDGNFSIEMLISVKTAAKNIKSVVKSSMLISDYYKEGRFVGNPKIEIKRLQKKL
jgi:hypothetical protein